MLLLPDLSRPGRTYDRPPAAGTFGGLAVSIPVLADQGRNGHRWAPLKVLPFGTDQSGLARDETATRPLVAVHVEGDGHLSHSGARIAIVEGHDIARAGLRSVLAELTLTRLVGQATSAVEAVALCRAERPDVVLVNLTLPDSRGNSLIGRLRQVSPRTAIVVLSTDDNPQAVVDAIQAGASGYLLLGMQSSELAAAVDRAVAGEAFVDPALAGRVVQLFATGMGLPTGASHPVPLTARELEVLNAIARGRSNKEIAGDLHVAAGTAKVHVERILRKLRVSNRAEATMRAVRLGILDPTNEEGHAAEAERADWR